MEAPRLGPYRLGRRLAVGGMAEVFAATREGAAGFEKEVALKRILPHLVDDPELVGMFLDEARLASRLTHANIAQVFDFGEADGSFFIVMEWIRGKDLRRVMRAAEKAGTPISPLHAALVGRDVARALACAHGLEGADGEALGLVHRDVSPQNVLVSFEGEVKLTDFGIAKIATGRSHTAAGVIKGKCAYMSPEQARGETLDGRTDLFALGVVLWELLTGRGLFTGRADAEILRAVETFDPPPVRTIRGDVPEDLEAVIARALAKDRAARFESAQGMASALGDVVLAHAGSSMDLDLGALMRRLFPDEAAGRRPATARLHRPEAGAAPPSERPGGPEGAGAVAAPRRSVPTPPEPGETRADRVLPGGAARSAPAKPASPRSSETVALEAPRPGRRWVRPGLAAGALAAGLAVVLLAVHPWHRPPARAAKTVARSPRIATVQTAAAPRPTPPRAAPLRPAPPASSPAPSPGPHPMSPPPAPPRTVAAPAPRHARRHVHRRAHRTHPKAPSPRPGRPAPSPATGIQVLAPAPGAAPAAAPAAPATATLPAGTHLAARLARGADSTGRTPAEVRLVRSVIRGGRVLLPRGTRLVGQSRATGDRLAVRFTRLVLPGGRTRSIAATALGPDGLPGLPVPDAVTDVGRGRVLALPRDTDVVVRLDADVAFRTPSP